MLDISEIVCVLSLMRSFPLFSLRLLMYCLGAVLRLFLNSVCKDEREMEN